MVTFARLLSAALSVVLLLPVTAFAQAAITGVVRDASGGVIFTACVVKKRLSFAYCALERLVVEPLNLPPSLGCHWKTLISGLRHKPAGLLPLSSQ